MTNAVALEEAVAVNLELVRARILAAGGDLDAVRIVAVTKGFGPDAVRAALLAGLSAIGENYAGELLEKAGGPSCAGASWHFLGQIQRNKIARLVPFVALFQSVDRLEEAVAIAHRRPGAAVLVEVATGVDPTGARGGVAPGEVDRFVASLSRLELEVQGVMTVAPQGAPDAARRAFSTVRELRDRLGLAEASMGMSDDLELAVGEGSTMVRVGRALFGARAGGLAPPDVRTRAVTGWQNEPRSGGV